MSQYLACKLLQLHMDNRCIYICRRKRKDYDIISDCFTDSEFVIFGVTTIL